MGQQRRDKQRLAWREHLVGIDVAKAEQMVGTRPTAERLTVENDERGVKTLVERLRRDTPELISSPGPIGSMPTYSPCSLSA